VDAIASEGGEMLRRLVQGLAVVVALAVAAPAFAASVDDAKDTATEKKADAKKKLRSAKRHKTADDRMDDAKDTATSTTAKAKKSGRKAGRAVKHDVHEATK